jgi:hypothetical protein
MPTYRPGPTERVRLAAAADDVLFRPLVEDQLHQELGHDISADPGS